MFATNTVLAIVAARGGSKGLPGKNIRPFAGRPLIEWTIKAGLGSSFIDRLIVSTDCQKIASVAQQAGAEVPFLRPTELATDDAPLADALGHAVQWLQQQESITYDYILLLQPTSPLRTTAHINDAIEYYFQHRQSALDTLISVREISAKMGWIMRKVTDNCVRFCIEGQEGRTQRQQNPNYYLPNGAIYFSPTHLLEKYFFYSPRTLCYLMNSDVSMDIDELDDFLSAESLFLQHAQNQLIKE